MRDKDRDRDNKQMVTQKIKERPTPIGVVAVVLWRSAAVETSSFSNGIQASTYPKLVGKA